jgi:hypothetical protein
VGLLHGRAGRLTTQNGVFRPGQKKKGARSKWRIGANKPKMATKMQARWRGAMVRRARRAAAVHHDSLAPLSTALKNAGLEHMVDRLVSLGLRFKQLSELAPGSFGGEMLPIEWGGGDGWGKWKAGNKTGKIAWGLSAEARELLFKKMKQKKRWQVGRGAAVAARQAAIEEEARKAEELIKYKAEQEVKRAAREAAEKRKAELAAAEDRKKVLQALSWRSLNPLQSNC